MDSFLSLLIFSLPGLLTYFWIQAFGITPSLKRQTNELLAISALLWVPNVLVIMVLYQVFASLSHLVIFHPSVDIPILKINWFEFTKISDFKRLADNYWFLLYFIILSVILSYFFAKVISNKLYKRILEKINKNRENNGLVPYSSKSFVWEETFFQNTVQIVSISSIENPKHELFGEIKNLSRSLESEQSIVLKNEYFWKPVFQNYNVSIVETYIDIKTGVIIKIYDYNQAIEAGNRFLSKEHIISSWE